jgi:hypothetical protein
MTHYMMQGCRSSIGDLRYQLVLSTVFVWDVMQDSLVEINFAFFDQSYKRTTATKVLVMDPMPNEWLLASIGVRVSTSAKPSAPDQRIPSWLAMATEIPGNPRQTPVAKASCSKVTSPCDDAVMMESLHWRLR